MGPPDWNRILKLNADELEDEDNEDDVLDNLYPMIVSTRLRLDDPKATPENIAKLFKVAQAVMKVKDLFYASADKRVEDLETALEDREAEISRLRSIALGGGTGDSFPEVRMLREDIADLEKQKDSLNKELMRTEAALDAERNDKQEVDLALSKEKAHAISLADTVARLKQEVGHYVAQLTSQKDRLQSKNLDEDQFRNQLKEKNNEINRYVAEIQMLSSKNAQMGAEIDAMEQELEATVMEIEKNAKDREEAQQIIMKSDRIIDQLTDERDMLKLRFEELSAQLETKGTRDSTLLEELQVQVKKYKRSARESQSTLVEKDSIIQRLKEDVATLQDEVRSYNVDAMKKLINDKDETIQALRDKLQISYRDFELLSLDWDKLDHILKHQDQHQTAPIRDHISTLQKLKEKIDAYKARHKDDLARIRKVDDQLEEKENELVELRARVERYESGVYGLKEAVRELKEAKLQKNLRDKEITALTQRVNDLEAQVGDILEENDELRRRLGITDRTSLDLTNLRHIRAVELEQARGLNLQLQKEIDRLEEERLRLKAAMRLHAMERGERAVELGLTAADLTAVEDYAEALRAGEDGVPGGGVKRARGVSDGTISSSQLEKLAIELERAQVEGTEARDTIKDLESRNSHLLEETRALEATIKELSTTLIRTRDPSSSSSNDDTQTAASAAFPMVSKLLKLLETKMQMEQLGYLKGSDAEINVLAVAETLRTDLQTTRARLNSLTSTLETTQSELLAVRQDRDNWKRKAEAPRKRLLQLPAELALGNMQDYSALADQLVECLMEEKRVKGELESAKEALETYHDIHATLAHKHHLLYTTHTAALHTHTQTLTSLQSQLAAAESAKDLAETRARELDSLLNVSKFGPDEAKQALVEAQRRLVVMCVNEKQLGRRYVALVEVEKGLRKENARMKTDMKALDKAAKETIGRLQRWKRDASDKIDRLQQQLADSVPSTDHAQTEHNLRLTTSKLHFMLSREREWIADRESREQERKTAETLRAQVEKLSLECAEAQSRALKMEEALVKVAKGEAGSAPGQQLAEAEHRAATLEVKLQVLQNRTEIAETKAAGMAETEAETKRRLDILDKMYMDAQEENLKVREAEMELRNSFEGGANREEHQRNLRQITDLESQLHALKNDVEKYKTLSDLAATQTADMAHLHALDEKEKDILRAAIAELQMEGEDKLLIGKLHHHILALQMSEAAALGKLEVLNSKCLKLESTVTQLEKGVDERENIIFQIRVDNKNRLRYVQRMLSEARIKLSGAVALDKHERTCELVRTLDARKTELSKEIRHLVDERNRLEDKLAEAHLQSQSQDDLLAALRNTSQATERVAAWHSKLSKLQLSELRLQRELAREKEAHASAKRELEHTVQRAARLEDRVVALQAEFDAEQLDWERRQNDLEMAVQMYEEERDKIFQAATAAELKEALPDRALPIGQQLETALRLLVERGRLVAAQELKISTFEGKVAALNAEKQDNAEKLLKREHDLTNMRLEALAREHQEQVVVEKQDDTTRPSRRETEAIRTAQASIASLQRQLGKKDEMIEKYRAMVKEAREDLIAQKAHFKEEVTKKTEVINMLSDRQVSRIRRPHEHSQNIPNREGESAPDAVEELEKILHVKEQEIATIRDRMRALEKQAQADSSRWKEEVASLQKELDVKNREISDKVSEITTLQHDLTAAQQKAEEPPKELTDTIARLKHDLDKKNVKQANLLKVIQKLRTSMQQAAEDVAEKKIGVDKERYDVQQTVEARTSTLSAKVAQLEAKIQRMAKAADAHKKEEEDMEKDLKRLSEEIAKRDTDLEKRETELQKLHHTLRECQGKLKSVTEERNALQQRVDAKAPTKHIAQKVSDTTPAVVAETQQSTVRTKTDGPADSEDWEYLDITSRPASAVDKPESKQATVVKQVPNTPSATHSPAVLPSQSQKLEPQQRAGSAPPVATVSMEKVKEFWDAEKKYQRKIQTLKTQLADKTKELEESKHTMSALKETISRSERDRLRLQTKINVLTTQMATTAAAASAKTLKRKQTDPGLTPSLPQSDSATQLEQSKRHAEQLDALRQQIFQLEQERDTLRSKSEMELAQRDMVSQNEIRQLRERVRTVEEVNAQLRKTHGAFSRGEVGGVDTDARIGEKSKGLVGVLESRVRDLLSKYQALETEKVKCESDLLASRFEKEQNQVLTQRLTRRISELEEHIKVLKSSDQSPDSSLSISLSNLSIPLSKLRAASTTLATYPPSDLLVVIEHLSRTLERLKSDNERMKKYGASQSKYMEAVKEVRRLKKEREADEEVRKGIEEGAKKVVRVEQENAKLRRQLRKEIETSSSLAVQVQQLQVARDQLVEEVAAAQKAAGGLELTDEEKAEERSRVEALVEKLKELKAQVAEKDGIIQEMLSPDGNQLSEVAAQNRKLQRELEMWRARATKLTDQLAKETARIRNLEEQRDAGNDSTGQQEAGTGTDAIGHVMEELQDLQHNYRQCLRLNVAYEEALRHAGLDVEGLARVVG
ncbi:hypothetical protein HK104_007316 [Borealophlyctis nickersoniae]|nr:hypothetical protein HK104_007316 [Borealophlyctis nickersoniae]